MTFSDDGSKTDEELVALSLSEQRYFAWLVQRYQDKLLRYILKLSNISKEDGEDILQDTFIKIYKNLNGFDHKLKFSAWAYRITHNQVVSSWRKTSVRPQGHSVTIDEAMYEKLVSNLDTSKEIDLKMLKDQIATVFEAMPLKYREVLILKFIEEKDYKEISDILQKPMGTIATLINRAKKKFKQEVESLQLDLKSYV